MSAKSEDHIVFHVSALFLYTNTKLVPKNYTATTYMGDNPLMLDPTITNIVGVGGMTRSGRVFAHKQPLKKKIPKNSIGKEALGSREGPSKKGVPQEEAE